MRRANNEVVVATTLKKIKMLKVNKEKYQDYTEADFDQIVTISFRCHTQNQVNVACDFIKKHNKLKKKECPWIMKYFPNLVTK